MLAEIKIPNNFKEVVESSDHQQWEQTMCEELNSLKKNKTWQLIELPEGHRTIQNKWIYRVKTKSNDDVDRYKARLVAKGCSQKQGIDFNDFIFAGDLIRFH